MGIPNTTPTPNELYNGEMKKMNDTELRVVLMVTRATLGWEVDHETGMRKQEDWISHSQLIENSGRSSRAISHAVDTCIKKGWIEARTKEGELLNSAEKRKKHGARIYYRLGRIFLDKIETIATDAKVTEPSHLTTATIATNDSQPSQRMRTTKETLTKETIQNISETLPNGMSRCPLLLNEAFPDLCRKYPNGHKECVEYIDSVSKDKGHKFVNYAKQIGVVHKILRAGFDFNDMNKALDGIEKNPFYKEHGWDFVTVSQILERK